MAGCAGESHLPQGMRRAGAEQTHPVRMLTISWGPANSCCRVMLCAVPSPRCVQAPAPPVTFSRARLHRSGFKSPVHHGHHRFSFQTPQGGLRLHGRRFTHKSPEMQGPCSGPHSPHATCVDTVPGARRDMWRGVGYLCVDFNSVSFPFMFSDLSACCFCGHKETCPAHL